MSPSRKLHKKGRKGRCLPEQLILEQQVLLRLPRLGEHLTDLERHPISLIPRGVGAEEARPRVVAVQYGWHQLRRRKTRPRGQPKQRDEQLVQGHPDVGAGRGLPGHLKWESESAHALYSTCMFR